MKKIKIQIMSSAILKQIKDPFIVKINDDGNILHAIAEADYQLYKITNGKFPIEGIKSILQLVYSPKSGEFYEDVGLDVRDKDRKFLQVRKNPLMNIPNNTSAIITPDIGC